MPETTEKTWKVTAYRDDRGREWEVDKRGRWYSGDTNEPDDLINGYADARFDTLAELQAARGTLIPLDVDNVEALLAEHAHCGKVAGLCADLVIASANLTADVETRARAMAQPRIDEIQRTAAQRVLEAERDRDFQIQRVRDLNAELGRQLKSLEQQRDRAAAQVKRVTALQWSLEPGSEFEQQLRAALHPVEAGKTK